MDAEIDRRKLLSRIGAAGIVGLAGCNQSNSNGGNSNDRTSGGDVDVNNENNNPETQESAGSESDSSVIAIVRYNAQNVVLSYDYLEEYDTSDATTPTAVVFHTGETPESGTVIYQIEDPTESEDKQFSFGEDFSVPERSELPKTKVTATFADGSTRVLTTESVTGNGRFISEQIDINKDSQTGDTVVIARSFNVDYLTIQSGSGEVIGRIDEEGGSVTIPVEDAYLRQDGGELINQLSFNIMAHNGETESRLELFTAGYPDLDYDCITAPSDRYITEFYLSRYDEIRVTANEAAIGTENPTAELSKEIDTQITEPTSVVSSELLIVEVETEAGHKLNLFPSPSVS